MQQEIAYGTLIMTVGLVLSLPHTSIGSSLGTAGAGLLGVVVLLVMGIVSAGDIADTSAVLCRPFVTVLSIMVTTSVARRLGVLDYFAALIRPQPAHGAARTFRHIFILSVATSAVLNNDAAVLLLTPLTLDLVRRSYPGRPDLLIPFAFAVFSAAGVAPLVISNPMNLIVTEYAGIGFNEYAARMIPISVVGWISAYVTLRLLFDRQLRSNEATTTHRPDVVATLSPAGKQFLGLLLAALGSYPAMTYARGPVWIVAASTASLGVALCVHHRVSSPKELVATMSWEIPVFLFCVFVIAIGLRNVGFVDRLANFYASASEPTIKVFLVGVSSALGSAVLNNHPMAILNALAIGSLPEPDRNLILAALIGGDLGPRLLPMGSLAGLLWLDSLRRQGVQVTSSKFIRVGVPVTLPALALSLLILTAMGGR